MTLGNGKRKGSIRGKLTEVLLWEGLIVIGLIVSLGYFVGTRVASRIIGSNMESSADFVVKRIDRALSERLRELSELATSPLTKAAVDASNQRRARSTDWVRLDQAWKRSNPSDELIRTYTWNSLAHYLRDFQRLSSDQPWAEILVSDSSGALVAATGKTTDFYQGDEDWWLTVRSVPAGLNHVGEIGRDESTGTLALELSVPIRNEEGSAVVGVMKGVLAVRTLVQILDDSRLGSSGRASLVDGQGKILLDSGFEPRSSHFQGVLAAAGKGSRRGWSVLRSEGGENQVLAFSPLEAASLPRAKKTWSIVLSQDVEEAFTPFHKALFSFSLLTFLSLALLVSTARFIASRFARPFAVLEKGTEIIREGNLRHRIEIHTNDELERLAECLNQMVESISVRDQVLQDANRSLVSREQQLLSTAQELERRNEELDQARSVLAAEGSRLYSILHSMGDAVVVLDVLGRIQLINPAFVSAFEVTEGLAVGRSLLDVLQGLRSPDRISEGDLVDFLGRSLPTRMEKREITLGAPEERIMQATASPVKDGQGNAIGKVVVFHDVTALRKIDQLKSDFVSTVSHELRTPLTTIREGISLVLDGAAGRINMTQQECLRMAKEDVDRLTRLISNILDITKIDAGRLDLGKTVKLDLQELLQETVSSHHSHAQRKNVTLELKATPRLPDVYASRDTVIQIMTNLLDNAITFTPPGGHVIVQVLRSPRQARPGKEDGLEMEYLEVAVQDDGIGVQPDDLQKLFGRFQQLGNVRDRRTGGAGMGLFITRSLVEAQGGSIWAESEPQKGTRFTFTLPIFGAAAILREIIDTSVREARTRGECRSLIMIRTAKGDLLRAEDILNQVIRGSGDKIVRLKERGEIAVLLSGDRKAAQEMVIRAQTALRAQGITVRFGLSVYPHDAISLHDLVAQAERELTLPDVQTSAPRPSLESLNEAEVYPSATDAPPGPDPTRARDGTNPDNPQ